MDLAHQGNSGTVPIAQVRGTILSDTAAIGERHGLTKRSGDHNEYILSIDYYA